MKELEALYDHMSKSNIVPWWKCYISESFSLLFVSYFYRILLAISIEYY